MKVYNKSFHTIIASREVLILRCLILLLLLLKPFTRYLLGTALMISACLDSLKTFCGCWWSSVLLNILSCTCSPWSIWNTRSCLSLVLICWLIHSHSWRWLELLYWLSICYSNSTWYWIGLYWLLVSIILLNYILLLLINICTWIQCSDRPSILVLNRRWSLLDLFILLIAIRISWCPQTHHSWRFIILLLKRSSLSCRLQYMSIWIILI